MSSFIRQHLLVSALGLLPWEDFLQSMLLVAITRNCTSGHIALHSRTFMEILHKHLVKLLEHLCMYTDFYITKCLNISGSSSIVTVQPFTQAFGYIIPILPPYTVSGNIQSPFCSALSWTQVLLAQAYWRVVFLLEGPQYELYIPTHWETSTECKGLLHLIPIWPNMPKSFYPYLLTSSNHFALRNF